MIIRRTVAVVTLALCAGAWADVDVRIATYNIENFDPSNSTQFDAAVAILGRIGADVVCVQEIDLSSDLNSLAAASGYPYKILASGTGSFDGNHHCGVMSKYPFTLTSTDTSVSLSGDPIARDLSRNFIRAEVNVPGAASDVVVISNHWKSGTDDSDEFRRSVESIRAMQVTAFYDSNTIPYLVMGDMNDDINDSPDSPTNFSSVPAGMPVGFSVGSDIVFPVANGVFKPLQAGTGAQKLNVINALQLAGSPLDATRKSSGRRLDYIWRSNTVTLNGAEVYDSSDEGAPGGRPKFGSPLPAGTSESASDHLLVFVDVSVPDDQSGACCTACGCVEGLNEAQCLGESGEFRGAGVLCGEEVPPCPSPPNDMIINEVLIAHDGTQDKEFVEIYGQPHELLCGLSIAVIEGETLSKGQVKRLISLETCSGNPCALDANGYFVAGGTGISPDLIVGTGTSIFEDGTETFALLRDTQLVAVTSDVDANNDGVADISPTVLGTVLNAVGIVDTGYPASDAVYFRAPALGPATTPVIAGAARCPDGVNTGTPDDWVRLSRDTTGVDGCLPITPGAANPAACGGDWDGDGYVDLSDFAAFQQCFGQATPACSAFEADGICGITLDDFDVFVTRLQGPPT